MSARRSHLRATPLACAALASFVLAAPAPALAAPRDPAAAEVLYKDARALLAKDDWAGACPKFEASLALDPAASTMLNIAKCHEHEGKIALAWSDYQRALVLNRETQGAERQRTLADLANQGITALEPRLPRLRVVVKDAPADLHVKRDDEDLPLAILGESVPVEPGQHHIEASAPGHSPAVRDVSIAEGQRLDVELALAPEPIAAPPAAATPMPAPVAAPIAPPPNGPRPLAPDAPRASGGVPAWAWIAGSAGIALGAAGIAFRIDGAGAERTLDSQCGAARVCDPAKGYDPADDNARKNRDYALFVGLGLAGIVGVGAAVVGIVTAPKRTEAPRAALAPWAAPGGAGASMTGSF